MSLWEGPTRIIYLDRYRRCFGGKPELEAIAYFRDHVCFLKHFRADADNISFTLEKDPGENICLRNGKIERSALPAPHFGCTAYGTEIHTLATTRRNELLFRYRHEKTPPFPGYPFSGGHFSMTSYFLQLMNRLDLLLDHLMEDGTADRLDLLAMEMVAEGMISSAAENVQKHTVDPRIEKLAKKIQLHPEENISISSEAAEAGFSRASFYREWARYSPEGPYHLLLKNRLQIVQMLLKETGLSLKEIAARSGFRSVSVLTDTFQRFCGLPPHEYRKKGHF